MDVANSIASFTGRKPRDVAMRYAEEADFTVLLRYSNERFAMAGFPKKAVESMSRGTALLCNLSSDLGMYLSDVENCMLSEDCNVESCKNAMKKLLNFTKEDIEKIKVNASKCAENNFDYSLYIELMRQLVNYRIH